MKRLIAEALRVDVTEILSEEQEYGGINLTLKKFIKEMQTVGASLTNEQILEFGEEVQKKYGVNKGIFVFILLSGRDDFTEWVYDQASLKVLKNK